MGIGCRGWNRTSIRAFKGRCPTIRRPGISEAKMEDGRWKMAEVQFAIFNLLASILVGADKWPARVTRPVLRIKSPLHHFNACRPKIGSPPRSPGGRGGGGPGEAPR